MAEAGGGVLQGPPATCPCKLFVGNLPADCTPEELRSFFQEYGQVADVHLMSAARSRLGNACAFVIYATGEAAQKAIQSCHHKLKLRADMLEPLTVSIARQGADRSGAAGGGRCALVGATGLPTLLGTSMAAGIPGLPTGYGGSLPSTSAPCVSSPYGTAAGGVFAATASPLTVGAAAVAAPVAYPQYVQFVQYPSQYSPQILQPGFATPALQQLSALPAALCNPTLVPAALGTCSQLCQGTQYGHLVGLPTGGIQVGGVPLGSVPVSNAAITALPVTQNAGTLVGPSAVSVAFAPVGVDSYSSQYFGNANGHCSHLSVIVPGGTAPAGVSAAGNQVALATVAATSLAAPALTPQATNQGPMHIPAQMLSQLQPQVPAPGDHSVGVTITQSNQPVIPNGFGEPAQAESVATSMASTTAETASAATLASGLARASSVQGMVPEAGAAISSASAPASILESPQLSMGDQPSTSGVPQSIRNAEAPNPCKVLVGNLPLDIVPQTIEMVFSTYGKVVSVRMLPLGAPIEQMFAAVEYDSPQSALTAIVTLRQPYEIRLGCGAISVHGMDDNLGHAARRYSPY